MHPDAHSNSPLSDRIDLIFGQASDPMPLIEQRAQELLPEHKVIVWEADAATFQSRFISRSAEELLGHPVERWTNDPNFWPNKVVHTDDVDTALSECAVAIARRAACDFTLRALTADGRIVRLRDIIRVVVGPHNIATKLRGIMIAMPDPDGTPHELTA